MDAWDTLIAAALAIMASNTNLDADFDECKAALREAFTEGLKADIEAEWASAMEKELPEPILRLLFSGQAGLWATKAAELL